MWLDIVDRMAETISGLSYREVSRLTGYNHETIRRYVTWRSEPGVAFLAVFVRKFKVDPVWLLTGRRAQGVRRTKATGKRSRTRPR